MAIRKLKDMKAGVPVRTAPSQTRGKKDAPQPLTNAEVRSMAARDRLIERNFCPESLGWLKDNLGIDLLDPSYLQKGAYDPAYDIVQGKFTKPLDITVTPLAYDRESKSRRKVMDPVTASVSVRCILPFAGGRPVAPDSEHRIYVSTVPARPHVSMDDLMKAPAAEEGVLTLSADGKTGLFDLGSSTVRCYTGDIEPAEGVVFVFGSNVEGRHGAGAAKTAREKFGAVRGEAEGMTGNAYAIPTKDLRVKENSGFRSVGKDAIAESIKKFYSHAESEPEKRFMVAYRNVDKASLSGYTGKEMMELFRKAGQAPGNVYFSEEWARSGYLRPQVEFTEKEMQALEGVGIERDRLFPGSFNALSYDERAALAAGGPVAVDGVLHTSFGQVNVIGMVSLDRDGEDGVTASFESTVAQSDRESLVVDLNGASRQGRVEFEFFKEEDGKRVLTEAASNLLAYGNALMPVEGVRHDRKWDEESHRFKEEKTVSKYVLSVVNGNVLASPLNASQEVYGRMDRKDPDRVLIDGNGEGRSFEFVSKADLDSYRKGFGGVVRGVVFHDQKHDRDITYDAFVVADPSRAGFARQFSPDTTRRILEARGRAAKNTKARKKALAESVKNNKRFIKKMKMGV